MFTGLPCRGGKELNWRDWHPYYEPQVAPCCQQLMKKRSQRMALTGQEKYYATMPIYAIGIVGNVVSVAVWATQLHSVGGARFLLTLSASDSLAIVANVFSCIAGLLLRRCVAYVSEYLADIFYTLSTYLTITVVVQRYVSVVHPFRVARVCSATRQRVVVASLTALAAAQHLAYSDYVAEQCRGDVVRIERQMVLLYVYGVINFLAPLLLLLFNGLLLRALRRIRQELQTSISRRQERARVQASLMALWVSTTTLLTCVTMTASNIHMIVFYHRMPWGGTRRNTQLILELVRDTCIALTLSVNVFFYSYFCKNFRDVVARRWRRLCARASCGGPSVIQRADSWPRSHGCCDGVWSSGNATEQSTHL